MDLIPFWHACCGKRSWRVVDGEDCTFLLKRSAAEKYAKEFGGEIVFDPTGEVAKQQNLIEPRIPKAA
jgi:hypothetical protein